jgi:TfoX/Sxy family transcriptional regulator of competence genes
MAYNEQLAERVRAGFKKARVRHEEKRMMGGLCFLVDGKMCVGVDKDRLMVRMDPAGYEHALRCKGCVPMDFTGRPMRGFVFVNPEGLSADAELDSWLKLAVEFNPQAKSSKTKPTAMHPDTANYNHAQAADDQAICNLLAREINRALPEAENKVWHAHPVWFLGGNPVVGYSKLKDCIRLLFWSGQSFDEKDLRKEGSFKAAEIRYTSAGQVNVSKLKRWLAKARDIQWDYKNLIRRKGRLERLK